MDDMNQIVLKGVKDLLVVLAAFVSNSCKGENFGSKIINKKPWVQGLEQPTRS